MVLVASLSDFQLFQYEPEEQTSLITDLSVRRTASWTHCGPLLSDSYDELPSSFHTWANASIEGNLQQRLRPFLQYIHTFFADANVSSYWLTIRATKGSDEFDRPRWHTDDEFFRFPGDAQEYPKSKTQWKLAATLLGPGTLFLEHGHEARKIQQDIKAACRAEAGPHACTSIRCLRCADVGEVIRQKLATAFEGHNVVQAPVRQCSFFRAGPSEGAVHSEPPSRTSIPSIEGQDGGRCDRIFVNAIPGTEEELTLVLRKWGMSFPRSWSIGVPLQFDKQH